MTPTLHRRPILGPLTNAVAGAVAGRKAIVRHLQPGVVRYENDDGSFTTYLLELDAIEAMRPTAAGIPVVGKTGGFDHAKIEKGKKYDGVVVDSVWDGESGWEAFNVDEMNAETAKACERGFQASCAYVPTETDGKPGLWHNVPYDEKILNGRYTHVAVVPNPRYEGATIELLNSIGGGIMNKVLKGVLSLIPLNDVREVLNSLEDDEKAKAEAGKKEREEANASKRAAAQNAYDAAMKNASSDEDRAKAKEMFEKANAEIGVADPAVDPAGAPSSDAVKPQLGGGDVPAEPGVPGQGGPAKKPEATNAESPEDKAKREKEAAEKAAAEKKNADDAAAAKKKKEDDERAEKERANALELKNKADAAAAAKVKAEADAKAEALRVERFNTLRRAAEERGGSAGTPFVGVVSITEKEDLGRERYGSRQ